jgi:putative peptidoglycan lipid II flippase
VLVTQSFSFWFEKDIVSIFYFAVRLMELPQGLFGISLATYLLPTLSGLASRKNYGEFRMTLRQGLGYLAFVNLFAAAIAFSLAVPIVRLILQHGKFGPLGTMRVAGALMALAPGLLFFSGVNILARAFYALHDIKTPMKISVFCLMLNLVVAVCLVTRFREIGFGAANTISAICNAGLLLFALRKKMKFLGMAPLIRTISILFFSAIVTGVIAWTGYRYWESKFGHATLVAKFGAVFAPAIVAGSVYWTIGILAKIPAAKDIMDLALQKFRLKKQNA